ncbi:hypothetical protein ACFL03_15500 [Thermodesulfobacteriota bacterium]
MKKIAITSLALMLSLSIMATSAYARNLQKHRTTIFSIRPAAVGADQTHHYNYRRRPSHPGPSQQAHGHYNTNKGRHLPSQQRPVRQVYGHQDTNRFRNGHWQVKKVWVPPKRHRVWKPGYSNSIGHWVPGRWIITKVERAYLTEKRVWIPR